MHLPQKSSLGTRGRCIVFTADSLFLRTTQPRASQDEPGQTAMYVFPSRSGSRIGVNCKCDGVARNKNDSDRPVLVGMIHHPNYHHTTAIKISSEEKKIKYINMHKCQRSLDAFDELKTANSLIAFGYRFHQ